MANGDDDEDLSWLPDTGVHLTRAELEVVLRALRDLVRSTDGECDEDEGGSDRVHHHEGYRPGSGRRRRMTTKKRLTDFLGMTDEQIDAAGARLGAGEVTAGMDVVLHVRVDAELRARALTAAENRGLTMSEYLRNLIEADLSARPDDLGAEVRDALHRLVDVYRRSTAA